MSKVRKIDSDREQFWRMAIATWQASGLSVRQFCTQEGLTSSAFYGWRKRLAMAEKAAADRTVGCQSEPFIRVSLPKQDAARLEIVLSSGHTLRIPPGIDRRTVADVLSALSETHLC